MIQKFALLLSESAGDPKYRYPALVRVVGYETVLLDYLESNVHGCAGSHVRYLAPKPRLTAQVQLQPRNTSPTPIL